MRGQHINNVKLKLQHKAVVEPRCTSLSALSSLAMMEADLVEDMADEYRQAQYNMLGVLNADKDLGRLSDEFYSLKVTFEESSISPVIVCHYLLQCTT